MSMSYLWVALGGGLGSVGRFWLSAVLAARLGAAFPWGTLVVNVLGSFVIGLLATLAGPENRPLLLPAGRQFFMIGVCGGFTTFSTFSLQTVGMAGNGEWLWAAANVILSVALCLAGVWLGCALGTGLSRR